ncbi:MAG: N-formylglutamate amidohydrolase, partial [Bdellovibrionaceae bacterium]|nr:N-formylglutamate amidohydrolase [Pseudobdellovibrionaceae bacterium]
DGYSVWMLDLHSMPSVGGPDHRDPGERRADVVISDNLGASAHPKMVDAILTAFLRAGFKGSYNWPYVGGKMTARYGRPHQGRHTVQIELNRALYMDEVTKEKKPAEFSRVQSKLQAAMFGVYRAYQALAKEF